MSSATIPGIKAKHAVVTSVCRTNKGVQGAADEAVARLVQEYLACVPGNPPDTQFHFVLTVERPEVTP